MSLARSSVWRASLWGLQETSPAGLQTVEPETVLRHATEDDKSCQARVRGYCIESDDPAPALKPPLLAEWAAWSCRRATYLSLGDDDTSV